MGQKGAKLTQEATKASERLVWTLSVLGKVYSRKMFGGYGLFHEGLMFALIADSELYLKADGQSVDFFKDSDCPAFCYSKANGKTYTMSYYRAPETFFEDPEKTQLWFERAQDAARRVPRKKKTKK